MRKLEDLTDIVIHCSADVEGSGKDISDIERSHRARGFRAQPVSGKHCGYNFVVTEDGTIQIGRTLTEIAAHCQLDRLNFHGIGICYIGGLDVNEKIKDTRTPQQKQAIQSLVSWLMIIIPSIHNVSGHRDHSPDLDGDGIIERFEWVKGCPCYNVKSDQYKITYL